MGQKQKTIINRGKIAMTPEESAEMFRNKAIMLSECAKKIHQYGTKDISQEEALYWWATIMDLYAASLNNMADIISSLGSHFDFSLDIKTKDEDQEQSLDPHRLILPPFDLDFFMKPDDSDID
jgi:hypothetical protein